MTIAASMSGSLTKTDLWASIKASPQPSLEYASQKMRSTSMQPATLAASSSGMCTTSECCWRGRSICHNVLRCRAWTTQPQASTFSSAARMIPILKYGTWEVSRAPALWETMISLLLMWRFRPVPISNTMIYSWHQAPQIVTSKLGISKVVNRYLSWGTALHLFKL